MIRPMLRSRGKRGQKVLVRIEQLRSAQRNQSGPLRRWIVIASVGGAFGLPACATTQSASPVESPQDGVPASSPGQKEDPPGKGGGETLSAHPLEDDREADPTRALPRLSYSHLGMHIGGEPNDPESKRPWLEDIEAGEDELLRCYRLVDEPLQGGSFGVDLYVSTAGGAPEVRATRQKIGNEDFEQCMKQAFEGMRFHKPERPTMLSYSILFAME